MRIGLDKISSVTRHARISPSAILSDEIVSAEGYVIAVKILNEKSSYNTLELVSGRMSKICPGDVIAGALGKRSALRGYSGVVPQKLERGDVINVLNLGGVLGVCTSSNPEVGKPFEAEVLGSVLTFPSIGSRIGVPASVREGIVKRSSSLLSAPPLVMVSGTCMEAGKTRATCEIIKQCAAAGKKVAAAKLTGVGLMRDTLEMLDFGAFRTLNFTDAGLVSTCGAEVTSVAKGIVADLAAHEPDLIVLELGDGIMGEYGVMDLLLDSELMSFVKVHVLAANDNVGAWGAVHYLRGKCPEVDVVCGPVTDNRAGASFIEERLGLRAANAMREGEKLGQIVLGKLARVADRSSALLH